MATMSEKYFGLTDVSAVVALLRLLGTDRAACSGRFICFEDSAMPPWLNLMLESLPALLWACYPASPCR